MLITTFRSLRMRPLSVSEATFFPARVRLHVIVKFGLHGDLRIYRRRFGTSIAIGMSLQDAVVTAREAEVPTLHSN